MTLFFSDVFPFDPENDLFFAMAFSPFPSIEVYFPENRKRIRLLLQFDRYSLFLSLLSDMLIFFSPPLEVLGGLRPVMELFFLGGGLFLP